MITQNMKVNELRHMNRDDLKDLEVIQIIKKEDEPLAALIPYKMFMDMQRVLEEMEKRCFIHGQGI